MPPIEEISPKILDMNQKAILETLTQNNGSLPFLELKKKSKLANMYFLKALEKLTADAILYEKQQNSETWIFLREK